MTYIPSTPIKYVKADSTATATGFGTHLWDFASNQDAEFCRKATASYDNTKLKGLYFSNWHFNIGAFSLDYQYNVFYNTLGDNITVSNYTGNQSYKNAYVGSMTQIYSVAPWWNSIVALGAPKYGINSSGTKNSVGAARSTSRNLNSHIFMLPIAENK